MNEKTKKTIKIVVDVILWLFLILALVMTIFAFTAQSSSAGFPKIGNKCLLTVESDSMQQPGGFKKGDLIIGQILSEEEKNDLLIDDVITFYTDLTPNDGIDNKELNTHRIVDIAPTVDSSGDRMFVTKGDNEDEIDNHRVEYSEIVAKWTGKRIPLVGAIIGFLQSSTGFLICIVLPLLAFFAYELYLFISTFLKIKNKDKRKITAEEEELIKQRAVEEYLRQQAARNSGNSDTNSKN